MQSLHDEEFGEINIRRNLRSQSIKISVTTSGSLKATLPAYAPIFMLHRLIKSSRKQLRQMIEKQQPKYHLADGMEIGKSHKLVVAVGVKTHAQRSGQQIIVHLQPGDSLKDPVVEKIIRTEIIKALRVEAKSYLPNRLKYLSDQLGCSYEKVRFSHACSRWGSYSSTGTISLNIALMKLPFELIDYVIIHELCHTKQLNHSSRFWELVHSADPNYRQHRKELKSHSPTI